MSDKPNNEVETKPFTGTMTSAMAIVVRLECVDGKITRVIHDAFYDYTAHESTRSDGAKVVYVTSELKA